MALEDQNEPRLYGVINGSDKNPVHYVRYAIHCAPGSATCAGASAKAPNALFGSPNIPWFFHAPLLDGSREIGPGCTGCYSAMLSLSGTYAMQAHGIPVTYSLIEAAHSNFDPGTAPFKHVLDTYDHAFDLFFSRLASIGITCDNTLFVFMGDEGDHFSAGAEYGTGALGWLNAGSFRVAPEDVNIKPDVAPLVYLKNPADVPAALESLRFVPHWEYVANTTALAASHISSSANAGLLPRQPSFILYGEANTWWYGSGPGATDRRFVQGHAKWDHGTVSPDITTTWMAFVGPDVPSQEIGTFVDHVDAVPTIDYMLGYPIPSYTDGRILYEALRPSDWPASLRSDETEVAQLALMYKELNAPLGTFSLASLLESTQISLQATTSAGRARDAQLAGLVSQRDALASRLQAAVNAAVQGAPVDHAQAKNLLWEANSLLNKING
jgi:hypothetical protein